MLIFERVCELAFDFVETVIFHHVLVLAVSFRFASCVETQFFQAQAEAAGSVLEVHQSIPLF